MAALSPCSRREDSIRAGVEGPRCPGCGSEETTPHHLRPPISLNQMRLALQDWFQDKAKLERGIRVRGPGDDQEEYKCMVEVQIEG